MRTHLFRAVAVPAAIGPEAGVAANEGLWSPPPPPAGDAVRCGAEAPPEGDDDLDYYLGGYAGI